MKRMNKDDRRSRFALTLLLAAIIFAFIVGTLLLAAIVGYILIQSGVMESLSEKALTPNGIMLMLMILSLLLGAILSITISKFPLRPLNQIITQMNRLADGDFKARLQIGGPLARHSAFREMIESFNKMAQELEKTEMLRADFVNNFSHEFKTPIVSIAGFAKLLQRGNLTEEQRREYINIIENESRRLSTMATNVLTLTKYENQTILTDITEFNLSEELRSCILALEGKWEKKDIEFVLDFEEYSIRGNQDMLRHVWMNLIDNAIKFSPEGGSVEIEVKKQEGRYQIRIRNHGESIRPEQQEKIFKKFYQADESHATEGNGIGLALVQKITSLHGGRVWVQSEEKATTFFVELPVDPEDRKKNK